MTEYPYPCAVCGKTVTYKRRPNKGKPPRHETCRDRENNQAAYQREKAAKAQAKPKQTRANQAGEGVRFTGAKMKKVNGRLDKLAALYLELTDANGRAVSHADPCDYLQLAAAFAELRAPWFVERCEKLYSERSKTK